MMFEHPAMDLEPDYYSAIGEFVFRCAQLEYQLHEVVWFALGTHYEKGRILTVGMGAKAVRGILATATANDKWVKSKRHIQEIGSILGDARKIGEIRNRVAHGTWQSIDGRAKNARLHYMKEKEERILPRRAESFDSSEIFKLCKKLKSLNLRAQRLIVELGGVPPPGLEKYAPA